MPAMPRRRLQPCETLERRACPAVVTLAPGFDIGEADAPRTLTVSLDAPAAQPVSVAYAVTGTASPGADFKLVLDGRRIDLPLGRLTFAPGEVQKHLSVEPYDDNVREGDESFTFTLRPMGGVTLGNRMATVTIVDNDVFDVRIIPLAPGGQLQPGRPNELVMQLVSPRTGQVVPATTMQRFYVNTRDGSAVAGTDYLPLDRLPVTFAPGQSEQRFRVNVLEVPRDANGEYVKFDQVFFITTDPYDPASSEPVEVRVEVEGKGPAPLPVASFVADTVSQREGNSGLTDFVFTVRFDVPLFETATIDYVTRDGSARATDGDYVATSGTLTFRPGVREQRIVVQVKGDQTFEDDETFFVDLFNPVPEGIGIPQATARGVIVNDERDVPGFQIDLVFVETNLGTVPQEVQAIAREAATRWERIIVGDLPSLTVDGAFIDDFLLTVQWGLLGGQPNGNTGTIANAAPTPPLRDNGLPVRGVTGLNPFYVADVGTPADRNWVLDVFSHELAHALGFSPSLDVFSRYVTGDQFAGPNALREYNALFGLNAAGVPLETGGGQGTVGAHWKGDVFGDELMIGYAAQKGTRSYISRVTIGAFDDLGYQVDYAAAEPYVKPDAPAGGGDPNPAPNPNPNPNPNPPPGGGGGFPAGPELKTGLAASRPAVDLTGNGVADLVWESADGVAIAWIDGNPGLARRLGGGGGWRLAATGDFDGDGVSDLAWRSPAGEYVLWLMEPTGGTSTQRLLGGGGGWSLEATGDYDGDGKTDLVWRNDGNGVNVMWLMNDGVATRQTVLGGDHDWRLVATDERFDADGDGRTDLVWRHAASGASIMWTMQGGTTLATRVLGGDHTWRITAAGDFDGDGKGDLLWRSSVNGAVVMHLLDDGLVRQSRLLGGDLSRTVAGTTSGGGTAAIYWRELGGSIVRESLTQASAQSTRLGGDAVWRLLGRPGQAA